MLELFFFISSFLFQLLNPESCWRAVWTNDAGVHDGGYSAPWHEDIRNCHCKQFSTRLSMSVRNVIIIVIIIFLMVESYCLFVETERVYADGNCHWNLFWILAGSVLLHLFPCLPVQRSDYHAADVVFASKYLTLPMKRVYDMLTSC